MISSTLYLDSIRWRVKVFLAATSEELYVMNKSLMRIGCPFDTRQEIAKLVNEQSFDTGFTYSNKIERESVMVIGIADAPEQYFNSFVHELRHLCDDIASANDMGLHGEPVAYLSGEIAQALFHTVHPLFCCQLWHIHDDV